MTKKPSSTQDSDSFISPPGRPSSVIEIISPDTLVINCGRREGVKVGQQFLVYDKSEKELHDPTTNENLGHLEIVRGTGEVKYVQEKMSTIVSNRRTSSSRTIRRGGGSVFFPFTQQETTVEESEPAIVPFINPSKGDLVRPI